MKASLAMSVSVAGVLIAGGAAFAANERALGDDTTVAKTSQIIAPAAFTESIDNLTISTSAVPDALTAQAAAPATGPDSAYDIAGIGLLTLRSTDAGLVVVDVVTQPGYKYATSQESADRLLIEFQSASQTVEFKARLIDGRIVTAVEAKDVSAIQNDDDKEGDVDEDDDEDEDDEDEDDEDEDDEDEDDEDEDDDDEDR